MKKNIKKNVLAVAIAAMTTGIPYACARTYESGQMERAYLMDFIQYCKTCENLRQVNPAKDYTKASLHELKSAARFYVEQYDFADCTDYENQLEIDNIIK